MGLILGARVCVEGLGLSMDFDLEFVMEVVVWVESNEIGLRERCRWKWRWGKEEIVAVKQREERGKATGR